MLSHLVTKNGLNGPTAVERAHDHDIARFVIRRSFGKASGRIANNRITLSVVDGGFCGTMSSFLRGQPPGGSGLHERHIDEERQRDSDERPLAHSLKTRVG